MYNIIFTIEKTVYDNFYTEQGKELTEGFKELGTEWAGIIPEFRELNGKVGLQADAPSLEVVEQIKGILQSIGSPEIIGVWQKETGEQVGDFNHALYLDMLADEVSYDENGYELSRERPAELRQVNKWSGQVDRNISFL